MGILGVSCLMGGPQTHHLLVLSSLWPLCLRGESA
jgi:hypothetical protein